MYLHNHCMMVLQKTLSSQPLMVLMVCKPLTLSTTYSSIVGTIFAYGQTSSGKTFTMKGNNETHGIIPLSITDIFSHIENVCNLFILICFVLIVFLVSFSRVSFACIVHGDIQWNYSRLAQSRSKKLEDSRRYWGTSSILSCHILITIIERNLCWWDKRSNSCVSRASSCTDAKRGR